MLRPGYDSAVAWVKNELELNPPPPPPDTNTWPPPQKPRPPNPLEQPPQNTAPSTAPEAQATAEPDKTEPDTPEPSTPEPSTDEPKAGNTKGSGKGSAVAKAGQSTSKTGSSKTKGQPKAGETEAQPEKPKTLEAALKDEPNTTVEENPSGEAVVLDTKDPRKMKKAGIGLLTLYTLPRAAVFDGNTSLGTTPLMKVPLQAGTYRLRIVDSEGNSHLFSAPVVIAKDNKYTITVSDLPLYKD